MRVAEVVEDVEEPVLQREPVGVAGLGGDVGVRRRLRAGCNVALPQLVAAAGAKRIPGEVEVVAVEPATQLGPRRTDRDQVGVAPRPAQRDRVVAEDDVDVDRPVRLARSAHLLLLHELEHRREAFRQRALCVQRADARTRPPGGREAGKRSEGGHEGEPQSDGSGHLAGVGMFTQ